MHHIDILDKEITIDGHLLRFPLSYEEIKAELKQFSNLKSMRLLTTKLAALQKQCDPLGIVVIEV
ncbi:MAG: hypothetical protein K6B69_11700 [Lachnospiraceae bacterium]|nr:hypothetical protein [Lachnospiraceae bacterium]